MFACFYLLILIDDIFNFVIMYFNLLVILFILLTVLMYCNYTYYTYCNLLFDFSGPLWKSLTWESFLALNIINTLLTLWRHKLRLFWKDKYGVEIIHADFSTSTSEKKIDWNAQTFKNIFYMKAPYILTGAPFLMSSLRKLVKKNHCRPQIKDWSTVSRGRRLDEKL